jgi:hypothetical protein
MKEGGRLLCGSPLKCNFLLVQLYSIKKTKNLTPRSESASEL